MRISQTGKIFWNPPGIYKVSCKSDITYYPFDTQDCTIKLISWAYTTGEVILRIDQNKAVDISDYTENGEWELISTLASTDGEQVTDGITGFFKPIFFDKATSSTNISYHQQHFTDVTYGSSYCSCIQTPSRFW